MSKRTMGSQNWKQQKIVKRDHRGSKECTEWGEEYSKGLKHEWTKSETPLTIEFMRGLFDGEFGEIVDNDTVQITFHNNDLAMRFIIDIRARCIAENIVKTDTQTNSIVVKISGSNMIDFFGKIYPSTEIICNKYKYDWFNNFVSFDGGERGVFSVKCVDKDAVMPSKPNMSDMGFDLTVIKKIKEVGDVTFYDTGLIIQPSTGFYGLLYPRSSISKTGYMLANSVGVIDSSYVSTYIVALRKVDKNAPDIELPCRIAQLVPARCYYPEMVNSDTLYDTNRGTGGFGSSGK